VVPAVTGLAIVLVLRTTAGAGERIWSVVRVPESTTGG
jgi:hypothetical protein